MSEHTPIGLGKEARTVKALTHSGNFHADETLGYAILHYALSPEGSLRGRVLGEGCALVTRRGRPALDACVSGRSTGRGVARRAVSAGDSFRCAAGAQARGSRSIRCVSSRREQTRTIGS